MAVEVILCISNNKQPRWIIGPVENLNLNYYICTDLLFLDEVHEVGPLDLHRLALPVVQSQDEVEEVGLPQVGGRLLLEVSPGQTHSAADTQA